MKKLIIDRKTWLRGEGSKRSFLLRKIDDKMCCLGFLAISCGATKDQILNVNIPHVGGIDWPQTIVNKDMVSTPQATDIVFRLTSINDGLGTSDSEKEQLLKQTFAKIDIDVEFI